MDKRSWALHQEVARRLRLQPHHVGRARERVAQWLEDRARHPYASAWQQLLDGDLETLCEALTSSDAKMCTLRQASPFAGTLDSRTRWQILKRVDLRPRETR